MVAEVSDDRVLAAVERAARHDWSPVRDRPRGALWNNVVLHLGLRVAGGAGTRRIRGPMDRLQSGELIVCVEYGKAGLWRLAPAGQARFGELRAAGVVALPESPQHRYWREAREFAEIEWPLLLGDLYDALREAGEIVWQRPLPHSDEWFEMSARLHLHAWQAASAHHVLHEWSEPDEDGGPDVDMHKEARDAGLDDWFRIAREVRRRGRRDVWRWYKELLPHEQPWIPSERGRPVGPEPAHYE